jgi:hypothetical protein
MQEKSHQVASMATIYRRASEVMIWLGPEMDGSRFAFDLLNRLGELYKVLCPSQELHLYEKRVALPSSVMEFIDKCLKEFRDDPDITVTPLLKLFMERAWWTRVWVIQEFVLAQRRTFHCGGQSITYGSFMRALILIRQLKEAVQGRRYPGIPPIAPSMSTTGRQELINSSVEDGKYIEIALSALFASVTHLINTGIIYERHGESISLSDVYRLVKHGNTINATDPRDHVYGLLGLVAEVNKADIPIDYNLTTGEVFAKATLAMIREYGMDVLSFSHHYAYFEGNQIPSWSVDWFSFPFSAIHKHGNFQAHRELRFDKSSISTRGTVIKVPGVIFDSIKSVGIHSGFAPEGYQEALPSNVLDWVNEARSLVPIRAGSETAVPDIDDTLWRVPILNHFSSGPNTDRVRAEPEHKYGYDVLAGFVTPPDNVTNQEQWRLEKSAKYRKNIKIGRRRTFSTINGFLGLGPQRDEIYEGDMVCILAGAQTPYILRKAGSGRQFLIGDCYVHGIMDGEVRCNEQNVYSFELC